MKTNEWICAQTKVEDIIKTAKKMKWRWAGHIARRTDGRWTTNVLHLIPREKKRPRHLNARWVVEIKRFSGPIWIRIAADRDMWKEKGRLHPAVDVKLLYIYIYKNVLNTLPLTQLYFSAIKVENLW